jgi:drug/metabolite transporter (DMT)-like permease
MGIVCMQIAYSKGPAGAVSALLSVESLLMLIFDSVHLMKWPSPLEFGGFFIGISGVLIMIFPELFDRLLNSVADLLLCRCLQRQKSKNTKNAERM